MQGRRKAGPYISAIGTLLRRIQPQGRRMGSGDCSLAAPGGARCQSRRYLLAAPGARRSGRRFADQLGGHQAGDKLLLAVAIEINRGALGVGLGHDTETVQLVLDVLPFRENVHNFLLQNHSLGGTRKTGPPVPELRDGRALAWLEADYVFGLQALGTLADLELNRLALVERLIPFRLDGGKVHEDVLAGLALNEPVALAGVKSIHCTVFCHCFFLFFC